jgi:hypothetical protein
MQTFNYSKNTSGNVNSTDKRMAVLPRCTYMPFLLLILFRNRRHCLLFLLLGDIGTFVLFIGPLTQISRADRKRQAAKHPKNKTHKNYEHIKVLQQCKPLQLNLHSITRNTTLS